MIRKAVLDDVNAIRYLMEELEGHSFEEKKFVEKFVEMYKHDDYMCFVFEENGKIIAELTLLRKTPLHHRNNTSEIVELCVDPRYRRRGIGTQMIKYVENICKNSKHEQIELCSKVTRVDAHKFYYKHNYIMERYNFTKEL